MSLKDWWKLKPYWLKGGLVGLGISLLISFFSIIFLVIANEWGLKEILYALPFVISILGYALPFVIIFLVLGFSIGCLMGWIIGKIKSTK